MGKTLVRTIILVVAAVIVILVLLRIRSPFGKNNSSFASEPEKEITRIELSQAGKKLTLTKNNDDWLINGKTVARKSGVLYILRLLQEIQIKSPVSDELFRTEVTKKNIEPVKVKVWENGKKLRSFLVYKTPSNVYGNIMKVKESSKPFIVYVPSYNGEIGSGFTTNELFWESYTVFNLLPSEIHHVSFVNHSDTSASFAISGDRHRFFLEGDSVNHNGWDKDLVTRYISYFAFIPFESWAFSIPEEEQKKIEQQDPVYTITVVTSTGKKIVLSLWELSDEKGKNSDRLIGKTNDRDELFIMRYFDIDPLIKKRNYFFDVSQ
jgi:hypothetical protein